MLAKSAVILAVANLAASHATFQSFVLNNKDMGSGFAVQEPSNGNNPILDVTSTAMICNGGKATSDYVEVAGGSTIGMQWHHNKGPNPSDKDEPIAPSHRGPVMVYMAPAESNGVGAVWTKIWEDGYKDGKFGVDRFYDNKGLVSVKLPNLKPGKYWVRPEIIALHEASAVGKAQFYNGCGQITVTGDGTVSLPAAGVDMTKAYKATDPGVKFDIYNSFTSYPIPGPQVFNAASSGSAPSTTPSTTPSNGSAPSPSPSPVETAQPTPSKPAENTTPSTGNNGSTLPKTFTINQFIQWLQTTAGSASSKARRHARAFN
ncbi:glycoside hydrolase family 61 protein [Bipolaris maydis ATCC 48331]|uniref:AA9 family lytic polysaccharide monooxygenase n=2 Tax=Cochliobolus heterostrophus TaxID=5016 RepID=M2TXM5_COCH5|nr:glycoside hydrolase family 61 protein [Bipolaris maydis ATCC 48331]EMD86456.1 glycoside hydrolase family 61 protein [Bipolaris maydis C5]KAH7551871.1 glycoside hydrolase family 61 protein [Bipolaris maydis]ENI06406.1 glycoside hydrolase family 61 protein [Bipolaris maydis ATCC 48331]KAJ5029890.1 glycoside hydrolase [Bipolaris maydis]KAJ5064893.1 endoglucanase B [Bipolaris maydis]